MQRFRAFVESSGGPKAMADKYEGVDESYVSQLLHGHRSLGDRAVHNMERRCKLPEGFFDGRSEVKNKIMQPTAVYLPDDEQARQLLKFYCSVSEDYQQIIFNMAQSLYIREHPDDKLANPFPQKPKPAAEGVEQ